MKSAVLSLLVVSALSTTAFANCESSFKTEGVPLVTPMSFKSSQEFPKVKADAALSRIAKWMAADGFSGITVNKTLGAIDAYQDAAGSGRVQKLRATVRPRGDGIVVDAIFSIQIGQATNSDIIRKELCKMIRSAAG